MFTLALALALALALSTLTLTITLTLIPPQVVTPRFIPTCSKELLEGLGRIAAKHRARGCWVQSHLAEVYSFSYSLFTCTATNILAALILT